MIVDNCHRRKRSPSPKRHKQLNSSIYEDNDYKNQIRPSTAYSSISMEPESDSEEQPGSASQDRIFFGPMAMDDFWKLYKSHRQFKDFDEEKAPTEDPRFAYLKMC